MPSPRQPSSLKELFPAGVELIVAEGALWNARLIAEEEEHVAHAIPARCREFAVARACARQALLALGHPAVPIHRNPDRSPIWPEGIVGSITHSANFCAAALARSQSADGVGIDSESRRPIGSTLERVVCTARERDSRREPAPEGTDWALLTFCAKEAFYKAWYPHGRRILDFREVEVTFDPGTLHFETKGPASVPMSRTNGRIALTATHVVAGFSFLR